MPIPSSINDLSTTPASNYPSGTDAPSVLDDVQRVHAGFIAELRDRPSVPTGSLLDFAGTAAPSGYLLCDGSAVIRATYAALFSAIGTTWGAGNGTTTFNVPDLRRKTTMGSGGTPVAGIANTVGSFGGIEQVDQSGMPKHAHGVGTLATGGMSANATHTHTDSGHSHPMFTQGGPSGGSGSGANFVALSISSNTTGPVGTGTGNAVISTTNTDHTHALSGITDTGAAANVYMPLFQPTAVVTKIIKT